MGNKLFHCLLACFLSAPLHSAPQQDIVDTALAAGNFKTLATALTEADLVETLRGNGPFTVFAPTDDAFAKIPEAALKELLHNKQQLTEVLTYHVAGGNLFAEDVVSRRFVQTLNGQRAKVESAPQAVQIDSARILSTDIRCSNGVIHVIDTVLMPATSNLVETASAQKDKFSTLLAAAQAAGLAETLASSGPFTLLAPTNAAFEALPKGTVDSLLKPANKKQLVDILSLHVIKGRVYADQATSAGRAQSLQGANLRFGLDEGRLRVNNASVLANDIQAANGNIHVIDRVLLPPANPQSTGPLVIGFRHETPRAALASQLEISDRRAAMVVTSTSKKNGLKRYDVIVTVNGKPCTNKNLDRAKEEAGNGGSVQLTIYRGGKKLNITAPVTADKH